MILAMTDLLIGALVGGAALLFVLGIGRWLPKMLGAKKTLTTVGMIDRVRTVGRLVSLEVCAKEIATSQTSLAWIPEILFRGRKLAMIFQFETDYFVDLSRLTPADIEPRGERRYVLHLPALESQERMTSMEPYDIQNGRLLGLLDVLPNDAAAQKELTKKAHEQAVALFRVKDAQYRAQARASARRSVRVPTTTTRARRMRLRTWVASSPIWPGPSTATQEPEVTGITSRPRITQASGSASTALSYASAAGSRWTLRAGAATYSVMLLTYLLTVKPMPTQASR